MSAKAQARRRTQSTKLIPRAIPQKENSNQVLLSQLGLQRVVRPREWKGESHKKKYCFACDKYIFTESIDQHRYDVSDLERYYSGTFRCSRCPKKKPFDKELRLVVHVQLYHDGCAPCGKYFKNDDALYDHFYDVHPLCRGCGSRFRDFESLELVSISSYRHTISSWQRLAASVKACERMPSADTDWSSSTRKKATCTTCKTCHSNSHGSHYNWSFCFSWPWRTATSNRSDKQRYI